ncbi:MAG: diacylglycerol O-acyltransferase [Myxococcota bacterium]|jgi:diacylglycerol O-acyltransferase
MSQMTPLDGIFLSIETPETPATIGGLAILDTSNVGGPGKLGQFDFNHFRDFIAERIALCPRFAWRVRKVPFGMDLPYWVEDEALDFNEHVRRAALPAPGGREELAALAGHLFAIPFDRTRPLWEMYLIEGLHGGRVAFMWKVHHCLMDGVSGAGLMEILFDFTPEPASRPIIPTGDEAIKAQVASPLAPTWDQMLSRTLRNSTTRNYKLAENLFKVASKAISNRYIATNEQPEAEGSQAKSVAIPHVCFNGAVSSRRAVAWSSLPIAQLKAVKDQLGVTMNDVILGLTGGAVRNYLIAHDDLPETALTAIVPVSTRKADDTTVGNQVRDMGVDWATDVADPIERILKIHHSTMSAKNEVASGDGVNLIEGLAESLPPAVTSLITRAGASFPHSVPLTGNAVVSNVRMPSIPLYIAGARIESAIPMSVLAPTQGLNITAISYCDEIYFGITADPRLVSDPWMLAEGTTKSMLDLQSAMEEWSSQVG